jgi:hypothetical protein
MNTSIDQLAVDEKVWLAWVQKGKLLDQSADRTVKLLAGVAVVILAMGSAFYLLAVR